MTSDLLERLDFWRDTANLRSREIIRLNAEIERLRALLDRACQTARTGEVWGMDHVREAEGVCKDIYK